jgi:hypothetical protein
MSLLLLMGDSTPSIGSLFASGEAGMALDVETAYRRGWVYQDSAGATVAAAAGDPVGLILDTARGGLDSLGSDLVSNGTFASDKDWSNGANWTIGSGVATKTGGAANNLTQTITSTAGLWYRITMDVTRTAGELTVSLGTSGTTRVINASGSYTFFILAGSSTQTLTLAGDSSFAGTVDNVTARLVPGSHAYQTTSGSRPALARTPDGGRRNLLTGTDAMATQSLTVRAVQHTLSFQGTGTVTLSGVSTSGPLVGTGAADIVSLTFTPTAGSLTLTVTGTVQLAQLETAAARTAYQKVGLTSDVTESGKRDCWGLLFDGSDDSLQTASVDFSATDKMTVMTGVRKLRNDGMIAEASASASANAGAFQLYWATTNYQMIVGGTAFNTILPAANAIPSTDVVTLTSSVTPASLVGRVNGSSVASSAISQGTGNLGNHIVYIGSRAGASFRFSGLIYTLVIRGATTPTGTIADFERNLLARRCGVTF